ncbi:tryptophan-rich sensory protein [Aquimarina brevivitae]|uniref:Tryptophan-rich sensory protein n=1 Tax=Aquimarina brevivitae TaxID=323412 RepID=A0A4Q7NW25_9FLAO|nr:tryptophan-rich sensory protein [Aquimarina brevivitae]RZS90602.1 hypothetical protein EV197_3397 [Aquimarina brevivitae]
MSEAAMVHNFALKWRFLKWLEAVSYPIALPILLYVLAVPPIIISLILIGSLLITLWIIKPWQYNDQKSVHYINTKVEAIHYSADLLLVKDSELSDLARIQKSKTVKIVRQRITTIFPYKTIWKLFGVLVFTSLIVALLVASGIQLRTTNTTQQTEENRITLQPTDTLSKEIRAPKIIEQSLRIVYPNYTNKKATLSSTMNCKVLEGSKLSWRLQFDQSIDSVFIERLDRRRKFQLQNESYTYGTSIDKSGFYSFKFYRLGLEYVSDLFAIEVYQDNPPVVTLKNLEEYTQFDYTDTKIIELQAELKDDYGIEDAYIIATVSKGSGESVKFREEKLRFSTPVSKYAKQLDLNKRIELEALKMTPGDELYFYVEAVDTKKPTPNYTRSETYFAVIRDTVRDQFAVQGTMGVDLMPEYFRSQRQIIIDTEKLIASKAKLTTKEFKSKSNELGYDQKVLRLKYGEFMGDEAEYGPGVEITESETPDASEKSKEDPLAAYTHDHDHEEGHAHHEENHSDETENSADDPLSEYLHNHDDPEESTLFTQSLKSKLRQALNEMWDAELYLRLYQPQKSLPYQYRALKLIKEIKNSARIYVHRIGFDPPPIKEEKRLTGELEDIKTKREQQNLTKDEKYVYIKKLINLLQQKDTKEEVKFDFNVVEKAADELAEEAIRNPGKYLSTLQRLKNSLDTKSFKTVAIDKIHKDLLQVIPQAEPAIDQQNVYYKTIDELLLKELDFDE